MRFNKHESYKYPARGFRSAHTAVHSESHFECQRRNNSSLRCTHIYAYSSLRRMLYGLRNLPPRWNICNASSRMCVHLILTLCSLSRLLHPSGNLWRCSGFFSKGLITQKVFLLNELHFCYLLFNLLQTMVCGETPSQWSVQPYLMQMLIYARIINLIHSVDVAIF